LFEDATIELQQIIKQGKKTGDETIKNFLFKGRWANITHFYIFHDDKGVDTDIRKNAHISIFTNKQVALSFFTRPSNGFTPSQRKKAERVIHAVFNEDGRGLFPAYSKLIYIREKDEFMYIVAKEVGDFKIGAKKLHDLSEQMKKRDMINKNNKYYCKFIKAA
jgi:hypothetical protein